jgi:hypothetical protein
MVKVVHFTLGMKKKIKRNIVIRVMYFFMLQSQEKNRFWEKKLGPSTEEVTEPELFTYAC